MKASKREKKIWIAEVVLLSVLLCIVPLLLIDWVQKVTWQFPDDNRSEILSMIGLILAGSVAGNFSVSYNGTMLSNIFQRYFAHLTKFALQLSIVLNVMFALSALQKGSYVDGFAVVTFLLYAAIQMHNIWDILRASDDYEL